MVDDFTVVSLNRSMTFGKVACKMYDDCGFFGFIKSSLWKIYLLSGKDFVFVFIEGAD